jgi:HopA1 effector protein family
MIEFTLTEIFTEILTGLVIQPDFTISHPSHPDFTVAELVAERVQMSDPEIQTKFLIQHLQSYLMGTYFSQVYRQPPEVLAGFANDKADFIGRVQAVNSGHGYYDRGWCIEDVTTDEVMVVKEGLHLYMPINCVHSPTGSLELDETVAIVMPKNIWTADRYVAISNYGRLPMLPITNIYWNCSPETAIEVVKELTMGLNQLGISFELQIEPEIAAYHRLEPLVLGLLRSDYPQAEPLLRQIYAANSARNGIPPFAKKLAPGLAVAETVNPTIDFAAYCCRSIANAVVGCPENSETVIKIAAIWQEFVDNGVVSNQIHLITEDDIYRAWES